MKHLYTHTRFVIVVIGHSEKMVPKEHTFKGIQLCKGTQDVHNAVVSLELGLAGYEGYTFFV